MKKYIYKVEFQSMISCLELHSRVFFDFIQVVIEKNEGRDEEAQREKARETRNSIQPTLGVFTMEVCTFIE